MAINIRQDLTLYEPDRDFTDTFLIPPSDHEWHEPFVNKFLEELELKDWGRRKLFDNSLIGSGLGSSASLAVALVGAANKIKRLDMTRSEIAEKAWEIETQKLSLYGGKQDQYAAVYGGLNAIDFGDKVKVIQLSNKLVEPLLPSLALFHTGIKRTKPNIQQGLHLITPEQKQRLDDIKLLTIKACSALMDGRIKDFGELMNESWQAKKNSNKFVTNPDINKIFSKAKKIGAWGGKLCGSGGGGCVLFVVDPLKREEFIKNIGLKHIDFSVDWTGLDVREL